MNLHYRPQRWIRASLLPSDDRCTADIVFLTKLFLFVFIGCSCTNTEQDVQRCVTEFTACAANIKCRNLRPSPIEFQCKCSYRQKGMT